MLKIVVGVLFLLAGCGGGDGGTEPKVDPPGDPAKLSKVDGQSQTGTVGTLLNGELSRR